MFERFFSPRGVAVIGASENPANLGYGVARNLVVSNYVGKLYFVNPKGGRLFDHDIYTDLMNVPDPVDLAVIVIPARVVPEALQTCGERGIPFAIIGSGGFRETGPEGEALELKCLEIARRFGIRVMGPNCIGFLDTHLPIDTTFLPLPGPIPGDITFISHSGAICEAAIDWARGQGFGLSQLFSLGNQMDLRETDLLLPACEEPHTRVITLYLEGLRDGRAFIEQAQNVSRKKPIIAIKVGRSEHGRDAVASHTGAMAGQDVAYDAAFKRAGVLRAQTSEELFDWARALAWCPLPKGRRMAVLTNAGGPGAIAVDALDAQGMVHAELAPHTLDRLRGILPPVASLRNPVDMVASAGPVEYANSLRALLRDEGVDGVMVILPPPPMTTAAEVAGAIIPVIRSSSKPIIIALMGEDLIYHAAKLFRQAHVPEYRFPERAASAFGVLVKRAEQLSAPPFTPEVIEGIDRVKVNLILEGRQAEQNGFIAASTALEILSVYGIAIPKGNLATSPKQAKQIAEDIGYPVALKVQSPDLLHKSDLGGVLVGLQDGKEVLDAYSKMNETIKDQLPSARVDGILVQKVVQEGQEVIVGAIRDSQFGPLVMFGSGGVEVEGMKDVAFSLAPLNRAEAERLLQETWAGQRLSGFRNLEPADREAVVDALLRISQLVMDFSQISEVEINPLSVLREGSGVCAVDVRLKIEDQLG
jgi:acetyl coenzyme A synthetase (ADP forming)-like protein